MIQEFSISSTSKNQFIDITAQVLSIIGKSNVINGMCFLYVPHTTAAVTINENADADVPRDVLKSLEKIVPEKGDYKHTEGNSDAHIKSTLVGVNEYFFIQDGRALLGRWQAIFFCEFDGPRHRKVIVKIVN